MSFIANPTNITLTAILPTIQRRYPRAEIKKPFLSPQAIVVPVDNYKMLIRAQPKRGRLWVDFVPPVLWSIIGMLGTAFIVSFLLSMLLQTPVIGVGALILLLGFVITKAIFKSRNRTRIEAFDGEVREAMQPEPGSIF